jgi:hypothetical protein
MALPRKIQGEWENDQVCQGLVVARVRAQQLNSAATRSFTSTAMFRPLFDPVLNTPSEMASTRDRELGLPHSTITHGGARFGSRGSFERLGREAVSLTS